MFKSQYTLQGKWYLYLFMRCLCQNVLAMEYVISLRINIKLFYF